MHINLPIHTNNEKYDMTVEGVYSLTMFSWIRHEWEQMVKNPKLMVALIVILFGPILYSGT